MRSFEDFRRRYLKLMVGIHVCGYKSELTEGTVKRGTRILESDEDMTQVLKDMYEYLKDEKPPVNGQPPANISRKEPVK